MGSEDGKKQEYSYSFKTVAMTSLVNSYGALEIEMPKDLLEVKAISAHIIFTLDPAPAYPEQVPGKNLLRFWDRDYEAFSADSDDLQFYIDLGLLTHNKFINTFVNNSGGVIEAEIDLTSIVNKSGRNIIWPEFDNSVQGNFNLFKIDMLYTVIGNK